MGAHQQSRLTTAEPAVTPRADGERATAVVDPGVAQILALQQTVGNAQVGQLMRAGRIGAGRVLQRYEGWEHRKLGDEGSRPPCVGSDPSKCSAPITMIELAPGVKLSWGQVVAIAGDEFDNLDELIASAQVALKKPDPGFPGSLFGPSFAAQGRLRAALEHDMGANSGIPSNLFDGGEIAMDAQSSKFNDLVLNNLAHFPDQGAARSEWTRYHDLAIGEALRAGFGNPSGLQYAYALEAFGEHYLTDCFSAGHIRTPRTTIYNWYRDNFANQAFIGLEFWLLGKYIQSPSIDPSQAKTLFTMLEKVKPAVAKVLFQVVAGAVSGTIHDYEGDTGVLVSTVATGAKPWVTYGDNSLPGATGSHAGGTSDQAMKLAIFAIELAKSHVDIAFAIGQQLRASGGSRDDGWSQLAKRGVSRPYQDVLNFVPTAVTGAGATPTPWARWRWGSFDRWMYDRFNAYARMRLDGLKGSIGTLLGYLTDENVAPEGRPAFNPHQVVQDRLNQLKQDPAGTLGEMLMWPATSSSTAPPPQAAPAGVTK
jgi:hypothetical protein